MMNHNRKILLRASNILKRYNSFKTKKNIEFNADVREQLENGAIKPSKHPGKVPLKSVHFPEDISKAIQITFGDIPMKAAEADSKALVNFLKCRHAPPENWQIRESRKKMFNQVVSNDEIDISSRSKAECIELEHKYEKQVDWMMKRHVYAWKSITYDTYMCLKYLIGRAPPEYAVIRKIFEEIKFRNKDFTPSTFYDFGSGVGTGIWALSDTWHKYINEYVTVDISTEMNDLARNIITEAYQAKSFPMTKFHQKRYLSSAGSKYDIVLCAYSLFEMPTAIDRLRTILNLWKKTEQFLVIVEHGTNAGFSILNEAREFIIENSKHDDPGYIFAPCPHESPCPRFAEDSTPCNFDISYTGLNFPHKNRQHREIFSYLVLRKGVRPDAAAWPRIVRPTLVRSGHTICRICSSNGKLEEVIFTKKKHEKVVYRCSRKSFWGDLLPISTSEEIVEPKNE